MSTLEFVAEQIELSEQLQAGRDRMFEPQDLPGRYGRAVKAVDRVLQVTQCESVLAGGWAVWHHGYTARVTQDVDIVLPAKGIDEFIRVAAVSGFDVLPLKPGRWPKLLHKDSGIQIDILPEGARPGSDSKPAPTVIRHPAAMGGKASSLRYIDLLSLIELKIAAGRLQDQSDVGALVRARPEQVELMRQHLAGIHPDYVAAFESLVERAREQQDK